MTHQTQVGGDQPQIVTAILGELVMLLSESVAYHQDQEIRSALAEAAGCFTAHYRRLAWSRQRYVVAFVGLGNVGKSTLLNAVLGHELAPRRNGPCTAAPIEFSRGDAWRVVVHYQSRTHRDFVECDGPDAVHNHLLRIAGPDAVASAAIRCVQVCGPDLRLPVGLIVADTPGFGSAQAGLADGTHETSLRSYLARETSQVFMVVMAEQGITAREREFHQTVLSDSCDDVLVTGSEGWDPADQARWQRTFGQQLGRRMLRFTFVSGKMGTKARQAGDPALLEASGINALAGRLGSMADTAARVAAVCGEVTVLCDEVRAWLGEYRNPVGNAPERWWRPDSWDRWERFAPLDPLHRTITERLKEK